jgi:hypothetical protein
MLHIIHFEGVSKVYISIHHGFTSGMYNWCFCNDFEINSVQFDVYKYLMHGLCATGKNHGLILHLVPRLALCSTLDPTCDPTLHLARDPIQHSECTGAGGWYIGGLWWTNQ